MHPHGVTHQVGWGTLHRNVDHFMAKLHRYIGNLNVISRKTDLKVVVLGGGGYINVSMTVSATSLLHLM